MNPYTHLATEFDQWAQAGRGASMAQGHWDVTMQLLDAVEMTEMKTVLDVGCGNGWLVREMLRRGANAGVGVDISSEMVAVSNQAVEYPEKESYIISNGESLPFESNSMSVITNVESLYYYPEPQAALNEWYRVAKKDGQLLIMMDLYAENSATHTWIDALNVPVHLFSIDQLRSMLEQAGWIVDSVTQVQDRRGIKSEQEFQTSIYWPSYEQYLLYRQTGSLCIIAHKS